MVLLSEFSHIIQKGRQKVMPDNRYNQNRQQDEGQARVNNGLSSTVKGIIAIMLTLLVVIIVIMIFAKSLFINDNTEPKKTGVITSTEYIPPVTTTTSTASETTTTKKTSKEEDEYDDPYDDDDEDQQGTVSCISAVYLHPEPTSSSENLLTIPAGAECKYFRNENGWYYVEYNGTQGYAWNTFFSAPVT